jgi:hypothetical protein
MTKTREAAWSSTYNAHTEKGKGRPRGEKEARGGARPLVLRKSNFFPCLRTQIFVRIFYV